MESTRNTSAWTQVAEIELVYKPLIPTNQRPKIHHAHDAYEVLLAAWNPDLIYLQEEIKVILLNNSNRVLGIYSHSKGTISQAPSDIRLILAATLKAGATHLILAHNHPSGNLTPSTADKRMTNHMIEAAALLDIKITDHLIITTEGYYSFADEGVL